MSSEPRNTASTTLTAATTSAASSAQPKLSTVSTPSVRSAATRRIRASAIRTSRKPSTSVSGNRSAASTGGMTAFSAATIAATSSAPRKLLMSTPGRTPGGHHQRDARGEPRDEQREEPQPGTLGLPGRTGRRTARRRQSSGSPPCGVAGVASSEAASSRWRRNRPSPDAARSAFFSAFFAARWAFCSATLTFASAYDSVDELLAARPAEDRDDQSDRDEDVPGGRDQLLRGRVVDSDGSSGRRSRCRARARSSPA